MRRNISLFLFLVFFCGCLNAATNSSSSDLILSAPEKIVSQKRFQVAVSPEFLRLSRDNLNLNAFGMGLDLLFSVAPKFAVGAAVHEAFVTFSPLFTEIDVNVTYAITGKLRITQEKYKLSSDEVVTRSEFNSGGFRASLLLTQYLFNATSFVLNFSGFGGAFFYEIPSEHNYNFRLGARIDRITNDGTSILPVRIFASVALWF
jgi:hypothetical protein